MADRQTGGAGGAPQRRLGREILRCEDLLDVAVDEAPELPGGGGGGYFNVELVCCCLSPET